jgi:hypothetical protein
MIQDTGIRQRLRICVAFAFPGRTGLAMPSLWFNLGKGKQQVKAYRTSLALGAHI